jgi:hypothetical protein
LYAAGLLALRARLPEAAQPALLWPAVGAAAALSLWELKSATGD